MVCNSKENSIQYLVSKGAINDVRKVIDRDLFDKLNDSLTKYAETKYGLETMGAQLFTAATEQTRYLKDTPAYRESTYSIKRAVPNEVLFQRLDQLVTQYENRSDTDQPMFNRPLDREINADIKEVFAAFPRLASVGTLDQYREYLNSRLTFPKILVHATVVPFETFDEDLTTMKSKDLGSGLYVSDLKNNWSKYQEQNKRNISRQLRNNFEDALEDYFDMSIDDINDKYFKRVESKFINPISKLKQLLDSRSINAFEFNDQLKTIEVARQYEIFRLAIGDIKSKKTKERLSKLLDKVITPFAILDKPINQYYGYTGNSIKYVKDGYLELKGNEKESLIIEGTVNDVKQAVLKNPKDYFVLGTNPDINAFKEFVATTKDMPMMMRKSSKITQDDKSYYRGQIEKPFIDKDGNLILFGREDELYKKAGLKSYGVSMTDNLETAVGYGEGQFERENLLFDDVWGYDVNTWEAEDAYNELQENGWWLIQIPKNINYEIVKEAGEVKVIGNKIIVPKGQYKIEQFADNVKETIKTNDFDLPIFEFDAATVVNARSKEVATILANRLALGLKVNYYNITEAEARDILKNSKIPYQGEPAFFFAGTVYTVGDNVNLNTVLHEFSHPLLQGIRKTNKGKELFNKLYAQLDGTTEGDAIVNHLKAEYPELEEGSDRFKEEALAYALQLRAVNLVNNKIESEGFDKFIKNLLYQIKQFLKSIFGNKVNVAKLDVNTSLEELADMLLEKDFIYDTDKITYDDLVAFARYTKARVDFLTKNASKNAVTDSINSWYTSSNAVLERAKNFKGNKVTREIVKNSLLRKGTTELTPGIKRSLSGYQTINKGRQQSVDEVIETALNAEELRIKDLTNRSTAFVSSLEITNNSIKEIENELKLLQKKKNFGGRSDIALLGLYESSLTRWYRSISDVYDILKSDFNMTTDNPFSRLLNEMSTNISESRKIIIDLYRKNTKYLFVSITGYMSDFVKDELNTELGKILKDKMSQQEYEDFFNKIIDQKLEKNDVENLTKKYGVPALFVNRLIERYNYFIINETTISDILKGKFKDVSILNRFFESYSSSTSPIVGALSIYLENQERQAEQRAWDKSSKFRKKLEGILPSVIEFNKWNTRQMLDLVTEKDTVAFFDSKEGNMIKKDVYTFLNEFGNGWRYDIDMLDHAIDEARKAGDPEALKNAELALRQFKRDYMHDEYVPEYYEKDDIFNSPLGQKAWVERKLALDEFSAEANKLHNESERFEAYGVLQELWRKYQMLYSLVNEDGTPKTGEDLEKAELLLKHRKETSKFHEFVPIPGSLQTAYNEFINLKKAEGKSQEEIDELLKLWLKQNTRLVYSPKFYEERTKLLNRLQELQEKVNITGFNPSDNYKTISNLIYGFKDEQGQPDPAALGEERLEQIKQLQQEIIDFRFNFDSNSGLERQELEELKAYVTAIKTRKLTEAEQKRYLYLIEKQTDQGLTMEEAFEMQSIFDELGELSMKVPTEYYLDQLNFNLSKFNIAAVTEDKVNEYINSDEFKELVKTDENFYNWFLLNHVNKKVFKKGVGLTNVFERTLANSVTVPKDSSMIETTEIVDESTGETIKLLGVPNSRHSIYTVKDQYRSIPFGLTAEEKKKYIGKIIDNKGNFLPRLYDGTKTGAKTDKYINKRYFDLKRSNNAQFQAIEAIKEYFLEAQEGKANMAKLYLDLPRYAIDTIVESFQAGKYLDRYQQAKAGLSEFWDTTFGKATRNAQDTFNYNPEFNLVNTDMDGDQVTYIPVSGLYNIDADKVSPDVFQSIMKYALSLEIHDTLLENLPLAQSIVEVFSSPEAQPKALNKYRRDIYKATGQLKEANAKTGTNQMLGQLNSLIERQFFGVHNQDLSEKYPRITKAIGAMQKASSTASLAINIPSDLKNKYGAMVQLIIEAAGAEFVNLKDLAAGRLWAFKAMTSWSSKTGIYAVGPGSFTTQLVEIFDPTFRGRDNTGRSVSRSLYKDLVNGEWMYMHRKFGEMEVALSLFGSFMNAQKVEQVVDGKTQTIRYIDAWEQDADGIVRLKKGIHPKWNNLHVYHTVAKGDTLQKLAKQYYVTVEELKAKNRIASDIELVEGDEIVIAKSEGFDLFRNQVQGTSRYLFGAYDTFGQPEANKYLLYRLWVFMRKWFTTMFVNRFGSQVIFTEGKKLPTLVARYDWALGKTKKGYYVTGFQFLVDMLKTKGQNIKYMTEEEKVAFRKLSAEGLFIIASALIVSALFGYDEDDEDKWEKIAERSEAFGTDGYNTYGFLTNHALLLLLGTQAETTAFIPLPKIGGLNLGADDYIKMVTQTSTAFNNTIQLYIEIFSDFLNMVTFNGASRYKRDAGPYPWEEKDQLKIIDHIFKTVGFTGSSGDPETVIKNLKASGERVR
jgi:LysM repeat protein